MSQQVLDPDGRSSFKDDGDLADSGMTMVIVTHEMGFACGF